ncbi:MAG: recombination protein RecR [Alphaproteobacteria bacterium]|nr:MAG: recombination protein RecR [Alphaproteobacteria bacterium]
MRSKGAGAAGPIERLVDALARLPGLGPRSARRAALALLRHRESLLDPLALAIEDTRRSVHACRRCGNLDTTDPCRICTDATRDAGLVCVVEHVADLWAIERAGAWRGHYHVLGGTLSALSQVGPEQLAVAPLLARVATGDVREVVLALNVTVDGQTTAHYLAEQLAAFPISVTRLAQGVPLGGELDHLDDGTLTAALRQRR